MEGQFASKVELFFSEEGQEPIMTSKAAMKTIVADNKRELVVLFQKSP